jgi:hypothetical protein
MNNQKPESLFQSMEKWIDLYRELHECSHNEAHDAFEDWAEKLRGESADQTTKLFHEAVKASYQELLPKGSTIAGRFKDVLLDPTAQHAGPRPTVDMSVGGMPGLPVRELVGGPLLETGKDPLSFKDSYKEESLHWGQKTIQPVLTPAEVRAQLEKVISQANAYLDELGDIGHPIDIDRTKKMKELAECRLRLIDEVEQRERDRSGKRLSLVRK